jgi:hypothetical protein
MWFQKRSSTIDFRDRDFSLYPPIVSSAWCCKFNGPGAKYFGIRDEFFDRMGKYRTENQGFKRRRIWSWIFSVACGSRGESSAFEKEMDNRKSSQLYKLPVELLVLIGEQLPAVSRLCMRRVCSKFRTCLECLAPELDGGVLRAEMLEFTLFLKQDARRNLLDQYNRRCDSASQDSQLYQRGCSGCLKIHRNSNEFPEKADPMALIMSPKTRICIGLAGSIDICEHISFSAECLLRGLRDFHQLQMHCQRHRRLPGVDGNRCASLERKAAYGPRIAYYDGARITIDRRFYLFSVPLGKNLTHRELFDALQIIDGAICPHLRTSSPYLFHGAELTAECSDGITDNPMRGMLSNVFKRPCAGLADRFWEESQCISWSKCLNVECDTRFGLRRIYMDACYPIHHIVLEVRRSFLGDPTHPSWKAQTRSTEPRLGGATRKPPLCISRYSSCKGPVCAARHDGLVVTPFDVEGCRYPRTSQC